MGDDITAEDIRGAIAEPDAEDTDEQGPDTLDVENPDGERQDDTDKTEPDPDAEGTEGDGKDKEPEKPEDAEPEQENTIPQSEFDRHYGKWKSKERDYQDKLDLLRRDPEAYYQRFPDERPQTAQPATPAQQVPERVPTFSECLNAPITDGQYQGYTLGQLWESENAQVRAAAVDIYNNYRDMVQHQISEKQSKEQNQKEQTNAEIQREHQEFYDARAQEFFQKPAKDLSEDEVGKIQSIVDDLLERMEELGTFKLQAAYEIATKDERLKTAQGQAIRSVIDAVRRGSHTSGPETKPSGSGNADVYERMMEFSEGEVAAKLEGLSTHEMETFWKKAPKEFRNKFRDAADAWV